MRYFIYLLFALTIMCCRPNKAKAPVENEEELVHILYDIQTAQVLIQRASVEQRDSLSQVYWKDIERIHKADRHTIERQLDALASRPNYLKELLGRAEALGDSIQKNREH